jgi:hypothetical protein
VHRSWLLFLLPVCMGLWISCSPGHPGASASGSGGSGGSGGTGAVGAQTPVTVASGQATTGVDIVVPAPASTTVPNASFLGVNEPQGLAAVTGDTVHQGASNATVTLFGQGIASTMAISFSGPNDITVVSGSVVGITASNNTPGIQFQINVAANAALGARTVILQATNDDITTFTGGLEVIP